MADVMTALTTRVEVGPETGRIVLAGRVDRDADATLAAAYRDATAGGATEVGIDFADVAYINSTGIALIVRLLAEARRDGRTVRATGLSDHYREIFRITRLSDFMEIVDDETGGDR